jgi:hypothetical protein
MKQIDVECPECGEKQSVDYWESINVDLDPSLRRQLFDAGVNFFRCEFCKYEAFVNGPLLYHDMTRKFCIQYLPENWLEDVSNFESYFTDGSLETFVNFNAMGIGHRSRPHVVFNMEELLRYIVFRELLHDRDMEDQKSVVNLLN